MKRLMLTVALIAAAFATSTASAGWRHRVPVCGPYGCGYAYGPPAYYYAGYRPYYGPAYVGYWGGGGPGFYGPAVGLGYW